MSRAALWRQEGNAKERERRAEEAFEALAEEGRQRARRSNAILPLWGPDSTFHLNALLLGNIIHSPYFQKKCCEQLMDWNSVIDEIYYEVKSLQPFAYDKTPSTAFCLLLRLFTLRMTDHQMDLTLKHPDSPYIRGIGFLYLRYVGMPEQILSWIEPYLYDDEEICVETGHRAAPTTIGEFVRHLFQSRDFYGTPLPRFPVGVEREIQVRLLQAEKVAERAANHFKNQQRMKHFQTLGAEVMALYGDEENPVTWYKAVIDRVIAKDEDSGYPLKYPRFVVTFPEYGNTETVNLGEIDVIHGKWKEEDLSIMGSKGIIASRETDGWQSKGRPERERDLYDEVRQRERDTATADKGWARRPPTTKSALASRTQHRGRSLQDDVPSAKSTFQTGSSAVKDGRNDATSASRQHGHEQQRKKRSAEEIAAIHEKKRKLLAKYG